MLLQVEVVLLNANPHNPEESLPQIDHIQQIVTAINALSKVIIEISSFLCHVVHFSCLVSCFSFVIIVSHACFHFPYFGWYKKISVQNQKNAKGCYVFGISLFIYSFFTIFTIKIFVVLIRVVSLLSFQFESANI